MKKSHQLDGWASPVYTPLVINYGNAEARAYTYLYVPGNIHTDVLHYPHTTLLGGGKKALCQRCVVLKLELDKLPSPAVEYNYAKQNNMHTL